MSVHTIGSRAGLTDHALGPAFLQEGPTGAPTLIRTVRVREAFQSFEKGDLVINLSTLAKPEYQNSKKEHKGRPVTLYLQSDDAERLAREILRELGKPLENIEAKLVKAADSLKRERDKLARIGRIVDS